MFWLTSESDGTSISVTAPGPQSPMGSAHSEGRFSQWFSSSR